jgi:hypothetical protein
MYWITKADGVNDEVLSEIDWGDFGNELQHDSTNMDMIIDQIASNQHWSLDSLKDKSDDECMALLGIVRVVAESHGPGKQHHPDHVIAEIKPEEVIDHGPVMIRDGQRVGLSRLRDMLVAFDDFLLTFAPSDETGQFDNLSTTEYVEVGIADGTPPEECYRALFQNTVSLWTQILTEINNTTGVRIIGTSDPAYDPDSGEALNWFAKAVSVFDSARTKDKLFNIRTKGRKYDIRAEDSEHAADIHYRNHPNERIVGMREV